MKCCQSNLIADDVSPRLARFDAKRLRKKGPDLTTRLLLDAIRSQGVEGLTLLDIGGGAGTIQHELITDGVKSVVSVEASESYNMVSKEEAEDRGHLDRIKQVSGDFVKVADEIQEADIVTLDRVICCYNDMKSLVSLSTARAKKQYGVVYPRDHFLAKTLLVVANFYHWLRRSEYREILHSTKTVDALIRKDGFRPFFDQQTLIWNVVVYSR